MAALNPIFRTTRSADTSPTRKSFNLLAPDEKISCGDRVTSLSSPMCRQTAFTGGKASSLAFMTQNLEDICASHPGMEFNAVKNLIDLMTTLMNQIQM